MSLAINAISNQCSLASRYSFVFSSFFGFCLEKRATNVNIDLTLVMFCVLAFTMEIIFSEEVSQNEDQKRIVTNIADSWYFVV